MATYAEVQAMILDDLHRADLTAQVQTAMANVLPKLRMDRYHFNELAGNFTTTTNSEYDIATALPGFLQIDQIRVWDNGTPCLLMRTHWNDLYTEDETATTGCPTHWAVHHQMMRLLPTPDASYSVEALGLADLSLSAWCSYAPTLVRAAAEVELYALVTHDMEGAQRAMEVAKAEREYLLRRQPTFAASGEVRPYL
jgi:hypothetical protein